VGHLLQNITFYKNNTDFNIENWAKRDIKILMIKPARFLLLIDEDFLPHATLAVCDNIFTTVLIVMMFLWQYDSLIYHTIDIIACHYATHFYNLCLCPVHILNLIIAPFQALTQWLYDIWIQVQMLSTVTLD